MDESDRPDWSKGPDGPDQFPPTINTCLVIPYYYVRRLESTVLVVLKTES